MEHDRDWPARLAEQIGQEIAHQRDKRGMTAQALAERCAELGLPMDRAVIAKLEKGRRQTITVGELLVFARALRIPPLLLVCPLGRLDSMEANPGVTASVWAVLKWFTGDGRFPADNRVGGGDLDPNTGLYEWYDDPEAGWEDGAAPLHLYRRHVDEVNEYARAWQHVREMQRSEEESYRLLSRLHKGIEAEIRRLRDEMRRRELILPPLPENLRHLDEPGG